MAVSRMYMAQAGDEGMRLDALCAARGLYASRSAAAKAIEAGLVLVGGEPASKKDLVRAGSPIVYEVPETEEPTPLRGEPIELDIRMEDDDVIVLSKQAGLVCHPSVDHREGTLVNALIYHCGADHLCDVQGERDRLGIVHRLDMDTSGLMLAAKNDAAGYALMDEIRERSVDRHYLALVHGIIVPDTGMIDAPLTRSPRDRLRQAVRDVPQARDAVTTFRVLERFECGRRDNGYTLIDCKLFTGRTHQIRVHMEYTKHPLVGDPLYTANKPKAPEADRGLHRQFLHSYRLAFDHPTTGERLSFADRLPRDLRDVLEGLAERSTGVTDAGREVEALLADAPTPAIDGVPWELQR